MTVYAVTVGLSPLSPLGAISALTLLDDDEVVLLHTNGSAEVANAVKNAVRKILPGLAVKQRALGDGSSTTEMRRCLVGLEKAAPVIAGGTNAMVLAVRSVLGSTGWFCDVDGFQLRCDEGSKQPIKSLEFPTAADPLLELVSLHVGRNRTLSVSDAPPFADLLLDEQGAGREGDLKGFPGQPTAHGWHVDRLHFEPPTFALPENQPLTAIAAEAYVLWAARKILNGKEADLSVTSNWKLMGNGFDLLEFDVVASRGQAVAVIDATSSNDPYVIADKVAQVAYKARQCFGEFVSTAVFCTASDTKVDEVSTLWDTPWHETTMIFNPNGTKRPKGGPLADSPFGKWLRHAVRVK